MNKRLVVVLILVLAALALLAGCQKPPVLQGSERDAVVAGAEPVADSILSGLSSGDYAAFSEYFDETMLKGIPPESFEDMRAMLNEKLGEYQSREVTEVQKVEEYHAVIYRLVFSNAPEVTMRLVLNQADPPLATGLWFDAPELRAR